LITTSRYPSAKTRSLAKRLADERGQRYLARGKRTIDSLVSYARRMGEDRIEIVEERDDEPARIAAIEVDETGRWRWAGESLLKSTEKVDNP